MIAQMRREYEHKQHYLGADCFIDMSWGVPRNLLVLFKNTYDWSLFKGENPFSGQSISITAQVNGVNESARWFFAQGRMAGLDGKRVQEAIDRLGTLFRAIRYSDKPSECSVTTFSYDPFGCSEEANRMIALATSWSLLVSQGQRSDKNSEKMLNQMQINRMLSPKWGLSLTSRGVLALSASAIETIFENVDSAPFQELLQSTQSRMTAPWFGKKSLDRKTKSSTERNLIQRPLPGSEAESSDE
jgi:hypothetical protein